MVIKTSNLLCKHFITVLSPESFDQNFPKPTNTPIPLFLSNSVVRNTAHGVYRNSSIFTFTLNNSKCQHVFSANKLCSIDRSWTQCWVLLYLHYTILYGWQVWLGKQSYSRQPSCNKAAPQILGSDYLQHVNFKKKLFQTQFAVKLVIPNHNKTILSLWFHNFGQFVSIFWRVNPKGSDSSPNLAIDGKKILKCIFKKMCEI